MSEKSTGKTVTSTLDLANSEPLSAVERQGLDRLGKMTDEEIDFSDIPRQAGRPGWRRPGLLGGPVGALRKAALAEKLLLVEPDVLEFFKKSGDDAPERMNTVLREYVEQQRKRA
jgi:uncharacterized protein (DUF4415 family)